MESLLQISAAAVRGYRNSLQSVNKLPPEVLTMVFQEIQQHLPSFVPLPESGPFDDQHKDWLVILHVCRHWRGIAATCPRLWSTIDSGLIPRTFLKRSGTGPLTLYLDVRKPMTSQSVIEYLAPHSHRFKEFHIDVTQWIGTTPWFSLLNRPAPQLVSLSIISRGWVVAAPDIPSIFADEMPNLRQLTLGFFTSWQPGYFRELTHLSLYHQNSSTRPSTSHFLDHLESCPLLEELVLVEAGPTKVDSDDLPSTPSTRHVSLPHLRGLHLGEWPSGDLISRLLSHLSLPEKTSLHIWGSFLRSPYTNLGSLFPTDISHLENVSGIKRWWLSRRTADELPAPTIMLSDSILLADGPFTASQLDGLPLGDVCRAHLLECDKELDQLSVDDWKAMFKQLPSVTSLSTHVDHVSYSTSTRTILSALYPQKRQKEGPLDSEILLCPKLTTLIVNDDPNLPSLYILDLVEQRSLQGSPIKNIKFTDTRNLGYDNNKDYESGLGERSPGRPRHDFTSHDASVLSRHIKDADVVYDEDPDFIDWPPPGWPFRFRAWSYEMFGGQRF